MARGHQYGLRVQQEKAEAAASRVAQFVSEIEGNGYGLDHPGGMGAPAG